MTNHTVAPVWSLLQALANTGTDWRIGLNKDPQSWPAVDESPWPTSNAKNTRRAATPNVMRAARKRTIQITSVKFVIPGRYGLSR